MPDTTADQIAYQEKSAQIAAEISARVDGPTAQTQTGTPTSLESQAQTQTQTQPDPPASQSNEIAKLMARLADLEQKTSEAHRQRATPPAEKPPEPLKPQPDPRTAYFDPGAYLQSQGIDPQAFLRTMVAQAMGDQADPATKAEARLTGHLATHNSKISQLEQMVNSLTNELHRRDYRDELTESVATGVDSQKYPTVAAALAKNPRKTQEAIMAEVVAAARESGATRPLTPAEAFQRLEEKLSWLPIALTNQTATTQQTPPPQTQTAATEQQQKPVIPGALAGTPPTKLGSSELTFDQKKAAILEEIQRKFGLV